MGVVQDPSLAFDSVDIVEVGGIAQVVNAVVNVDNEVSINRVKASSQAVSFTINQLRSLEVNILSSSSWVIVKLDQLDLGGIVQPSGSFIKSPNISVSLDVHGSLRHFTLSWGSSCNSVESLLVAGEFAIWHPVEG